MNLSKGLGFDYLSNQERCAYEIFLHAFSKMETSFDISQIDQAVDLLRVMNTVLGDNPSIIYFDRTALELDESLLGKKRIFLTGVIPTSQVEDMALKLGNTSNQIIASLASSNKDAHTVLISLYDYLQKTIRYDKATFQASMKGIRQNPASHNAYGALINKMAVCDGFSMAFSLLAQKLGYPCMLVAGKSSYHSSDPVGHAWNIVKVQNKHYHMDVTWDTKEYAESGECSYLYFALNDNDIAGDHDWCRDVAPVCTYRDLSYYVKNGLYASNMEQAKRIIKSDGEKHTNVFRIKLSPTSILPDNAGEVLAQMVANEVVSTGKPVQISYEWNERARYFLARATPQSH